MAFLAVFFELLRVIICFKSIQVKNVIKKLRAFILGVGDRCHSGNRELFILLKIFKKFHYKVTKTPNNIIQLDIQRFDWSFSSEIERIVIACLLQAGETGMSWQSPYFMIDSREGQYIRLLRRLLPSGGASRTGRAEHLTL